VSDSINTLLQFITDVTETQEERQAAMDALGDVQAKEHRYRYAIGLLLDVLSGESTDTKRAVYFAELTMHPENEPEIRAKYRMAS
jgi:hypothetical protein